MYTKSCFSKKNTLHKQQVGKHFYKLTHKTYLGNNIISNKSLLLFYVSVTV